MSCAPGSSLDFSKQDFVGVERNTKFERHRLDGEAMACSIVSEIGGVYVSHLFPLCPCSNDSPPFSQSLSTRSHRLTWSRPSLPRIFAHPIELPPALKKKNMGFLARDLIDRNLGVILRGVVLEMHCTIPHFHHFKGGIADDRSPPCPMHVTCIIPVPYFYMASTNLR